MYDIVGVSLSAYRLLPTHPIDGCFLGDPKEAVGEKRIFIKGTSQMQVHAQEARSKSARKLALKLLSLFFTKEEMTESLCTPLEGKKLLNPEIIEGIRHKSCSTLNITVFSNE